MSWTTGWVYAVAVVVLIATPGPSVLLAVSTAVQHGPRRALIASAGSTTAIGAIMVLSMLGLGAVLAAHAVWAASAPQRASGLGVGSATLVNRFLSTWWKGSV